MRIVNLAHGQFYALGAYVSAWAVGGVFGAAATGGWSLAGQLLLLPIGALVVAMVGAAIEPVLLRPLYRRPEEYILLITFGLLMVIEDVIKLLFGGNPLSAGTITSMFSASVAKLASPSTLMMAFSVSNTNTRGLARPRVMPTSAAAQLICTSSSPNIRVTR